MILAKGDNIVFNGNLKEVMTELTLVMASAKETFKKEYNISEEEAMAMLAKCTQIAFMTNEKRKEYLDLLQD